MAFLHWLRGAPVAALAVVVACGGAEFTAGPGSDGDAGNTPNDASTDAPADGGTLPIDGSPGTDGATIEAGGNDASLGISCGATRHCSSTPCCVTGNNSPPPAFNFNCATQQQCNQNQGTTLRCNNNGDCAQGDFCCISRVNSSTSATCAHTCDAPSAILCDPSSVLSRCPATAGVCSGNNIDSWGLPNPPYGTCGGVRAP